MTSSTLSPQEAAAEGAEDPRQYRPQDGPEVQARRLPEDLPALAYRS